MRCDRWRRLKDRLPGQGTPMSRASFPEVRIKEARETPDDVRAGTDGEWWVIPGKATDRRPTSNNTVNTALRRRSASQRERASQGFRSMASRRFSRPMRVGWILRSGPAGAGQKFRV